MRRLAIAALALLCALQLLAVLRAPPAYAPSRISVTQAPGEALELGRSELGAPQAAARQLTLRRDAGGRWWLRNLAPHRPITLMADDSEIRTGQFSLHGGERLVIGAALFDVERTGRALTLRAAASRWDFDGATVRRDGQPQPPCVGAGLGERARALYNRAMPAWLDAPSALALGGNLYCANRIGIDATEAASARIEWRHAAAWLSAAPGAPVRVNGIDPAMRELALDGATGLRIGRTRYALATLDGALTLTPQRHVALFSEAHREPSRQLTWQWSARDLWWLPSGAIAVLLTAGCAAVLLARRYPAALPWLICALGMGALMLQRAGLAPGLGVSMLLGWAALWCLLLSGRATLALTAATLLLGVGLLCQLELGLGGMATTWARHFHKSCALLAVGLGAVGALRLGRPIALPAQARTEWGFGLLALLALAALALQVLVGDETGVFKLQPVEFAKLALTLLTAHCLALGLGLDPASCGERGALRWLRWLRVGAPVLVFGALLALALVGVDDYSPLILLLVWSACMACAWSLTTRTYGLTLLLASGACALVLGLVALRGVDPGEVAQWRFYAERFLVWLDPATHPHTGEQMLQAARAIAQGGWLGADGRLGLASLGAPAGAVMDIPAVQDDFAPAFFLHRHGLAAGVALWMLQALFLGGVLHAAAAHHRSQAGARGFRAAWSARLYCFALCGGGAFVLGHLLLSWGTNLAIFPVMGQPMSFLSAGGSHLLFFICPLLGLCAIPCAPCAFVPPTQARRTDHAGVRST
ncbi:MAG: FtsW/RodA/SpoVE family cell cycle protein [Gammaproteobacteria bacterium]